VEFQTLLLSRLQFALTNSFHILFPTLSIGLALFLAVVEGLWLKTGKTVDGQLSRFWARVLALNFGFGLVYGKLPSCEFGTNFSLFRKLRVTSLGR
jgi:cytochrome d ubiquinol oxidase subunit I